MTTADATPDVASYVADDAWAREPMTLRRTLALIRSDYQRMADHFRFPLTPLRAIKMTLVPAMTGLIVFRFSHLCYRRGFTSIAWLLYSFNNSLNGLDIVPTTRLGGGCLLGHTVATILSGQIGRNATIYARVGVGGGRDMRDIGAGPGLPIVGDGVTIGVNTSVIGSVRIGDGAFLAAHSLVMDDCPPYMVMMGTPATVRRARPMDAPLGFASSIPEDPS